ncbi:unnamed protein product [Lupinus luteus]|uniref:Uncharacterized protein n=1 Tax=Lupinus luteus TaxID=3873 RepID=A0AAV1YDE7_LUPLU
MEEGESGLRARLMPADEVLTLVFLELLVWWSHHQLTGALSYNYKHFPMEKNPPGEDEAFCVCREW